MELAGKVALVTGGGGGIGAGIGEAFVEKGMKVVLTDLNPDYAETEAARIGGGTIALAHDVTSLESWAGVKAAAERVFGPVDVLVNNAGISTPRMPLDEMPPETFATVLAVNVTGVFNGIKTFVPDLRARRSGHVVNVSSMNGLLAHQTYATYSASKFAVTAMSEALQGELAPFGVGVSILFPGLTRSRMALDPVKGAAPDIPDPAVLAAAMMEPVWLGRSVAKAVEDNQLYVISHPGHKQHLAARYQAILDSFREPSQPDYQPLPLRR
ncbi:SDR family oxidoreductase [Novosphingobium album (ex Liu et al. 2023)]|uniref:SDR family NAD(P)-dependent oxidoreductase n=1 Tax=Novosphingobium album (ex Liu et al. 2023) TaxID=3031130 RepID=A0ABT5WPJ7_9SPHN|nr:SDR family oxidoreductase [Novosphingobium album (ex Liu et al. 2023)]MDE8651931.1 SDR family NAD(P)-dependent oxidoreductase [Novosphingobium album (ex Liu et al. 2023)]